MNGFYILVVVGSIVAILITLLLSRFFSKKAFVRYIPAIISAFFGVGFYIKSRFFSEGMEDLAYVVMTLIACIVFLISFITAFIIGLVQRNRTR